MAKRPQPEGKAKVYAEWRGAGRGAEAMATQLTVALTEWLTVLNRPKSEVSLTLVNDQTMQRLNRTWRKKNKPTDVLSFPQEQSTAMPTQMLGDIVISTETARRVAKALEVSWEAEMHLYCAHGLLHLLGYDHEASAAMVKKMRAKEDQLLGRAGLVTRSVKSVPQASLRR